MDYVTEGNKTCVVHFQPLSKKAKGKNASAAASPKIYAAPGTSAMQSEVDAPSATQGNTKPKGRRGRPPNLAKREAAESAKSHADALFNGLCHEFSDIPRGKLDALRHGVASYVYTGKKSKAWAVQHISSKLDEEE